MDRQKILADLADRSSYPKHAIDYSVQVPDRTAAIFLPILGRAQRWQAEEPLEMDALYFGIHLLAANKTTEAFGPLVDLLTRFPDAADRVLGENAIGTTVPRVLMALAAGKADTLWRIATDNRLDFLIRDAFLRAWTFEVMELRVSHVAATRLLSAFLNEETRPPPDDFIWNGWLTAISDLGFEELLPAIERAIAHGCISEEDASVNHADFSKFKAGLQETLETNDRSALQVARGYIPFGEGQYDRSDVMLAAPGADEDLTVTESE